MLRLSSDRLHKDSNPRQRFIDPATSQQFDPSCQPNAKHFTISVARAREMARYHHIFFIGWLNWMKEHNRPIPSAWELKASAEYREDDEEEDEEEMSAPVESNAPASSSVPPVASASSADTAPHRKPTLKDRQAQHSLPQVSRVTPLVPPR